MTLHQGARVRLAGDTRSYQLLSIDDRRGRCFVRPLPLTRHGSQVIEVAVEQLAGLRDED